jgi:hypothetical protein
MCENTCHSCDADGRVTVTLAICTFGIVRFADSSKTPCVGI